MMNRLKQTEQDVIAHLKLACSWQEENPPNYKEPAFPIDVIIHCISNYPLHVIIYIVLQEAEMMAAAIIVVQSHKAKLWKVSQIWLQSNDCLNGIL